MSNGYWPAHRQTEKSDRAWSDDQIRSVISSQPASQPAGSGRLKQWRVEPGWAAHIQGWRTRATARPNRSDFAESLLFWFGRSYRKYKRRIPSLAVDSNCTPQPLILED